MASTKYAPPEPFNHYLDPQPPHELHIVVRGEQLTLCCRHAWQSWTVFGTTPPSDHTVCPRCQEGLGRHNGNPRFKFDDPSVAILMMTPATITRDEATWTEPARVDFIKKTAFLTPVACVQPGDFITSIGRRVEVTRIIPVQDSIGRLHHVEAKFRR